MFEQVVKSSFGSLVFCDACGTLLDIPGDEDALTCDGCGKDHDSRVYDSVVVTTKSGPNAFPSALRRKRNIVQDDKVEQPSTKQPLISEVCPNCQNEEMHYTTLQLRSADEGTTVFFTCPKCDYKFSTNN